MFCHPKHLHPTLFVILIYDELRESSGGPQFYLEIEVVLKNCESGCKLEGL